MYFILKSASFPDTIGTIDVKPGEVNGGGSSDGSTTSTCTFTIKVTNPTSGATVTLTASGYTQSGNSITVPSGTTVNWSVSATGYTTKSGTKTVSITSTQSVSLVAEGSSGDSGSTTYTITYVCKDSSGATLKTTTETGVAAGTNKTFTTSGAPAISGYTCTSVSPTSATINSNTTVTYTYTANAAGGEPVVLATKDAYSITGFIRPAGTTSDNSSYRMTDYINIAGYSQLIVHTEPKTASVSPAVFFNADQEYISGYTAETIEEQDYTIDVPEGAVYVKSSTLSGNSLKNCSIKGVV